MTFDKMYLKLIKMLINQFLTAILYCSIDFTDAELHEMAVENFLIQNFIYCHPKWLLA